jgi:acyl-CoA thioesterase-1
MFKEISTEEKIPFLPFLLKDVAGKKELNQLDGIHPNVEGHEIVAKLVAEFMENNL